MKKDYTKEQQALDEANAEILSALSHPLRLRMARELVCCGPRNVKSFVDQMGVSQPAVSQHLSRLRVGGVVEMEKDGTKVIYSVSDEVVESIIEILYPGTLEERASKEEAGN